MKKVIRGKILVFSEYGVINFMNEGIRRICNNEGQRKIWYVYTLVMKGM